MAAGRHGSIMICMPNVIIDWKISTSVGKSRSNPLPPLARGLARNKLVTIPFLILKLCASQIGSLQKGIAGQWGPQGHPKGTIGQQEHPKDADRGHKDTHHAPVAVTRAPKRHQWSSQGHSRGTNGGHRETAGAPMELPRASPGHQCGSQGTRRAPMEVTEAPRKQKNDRGH